MLEVGFMLIGLGFFVFVIWFVSHQTNLDQRYLDYRRDVTYVNRLNEAREFGFDPKSQHTIETLKGT